MQHAVSFRTEMFRQESSRVFKENSGGSRSLEVSEKSYQCTLRPPEVHMLYVQF